MPTTSAIQWFKSEFGQQLTEATRGTRFTPDLLTALACQETGYLWDRLRKKMGTQDVLRLCVGDTLGDTAGRTAFPRNRAELEAWPQGKLMFSIARQALVDIAEHLPDYRGAASNPDKFCRGYGIFQYDLQFFKVDPSYFLEQRYTIFSEALGKALSELNAKADRLRAQGLIGGGTSLSNADLVKIAIAYNTGRYVPSKGLRQGHRSNDGVYYGEAIDRYLRLAQSIVVGETNNDSNNDDRVTMRVEVASTLNMRSSPNTRSKTNVIASLPKGHLVRTLGREINGFWEIETTVRGDTLTGFVAKQYLKPVNM